MPLTPKQKKILEFIESFASRHGYAPSQQEIAKHFRFKSLGTVQNYLVRLERQGALRKTWNARRGTEVVPKPVPVSASESVPLPLLGQVAAGRPIEAIQVQENLDVPASFIKKGGDNFVLRVTGNSMIEDGILDGDYVIIRKQRTARNGQTVVALIGNEATIKRFYQHGDRIELHPANPSFEPFIIESLTGDGVSGDDFKIEGVLLGVLRKLS